MKFATIRIAAAAAILAGGVSFAAAADPIEGNWKTQSGETAAIGNCGGSFCITLKTGKYAGKQIGKLSGAAGEYKGTITDPADDKTYSGSASVSGASMSLKGCAMKVFCKTQKWAKM
jgi:uncharacterized protein (DUF2147 family)